MRRRSATLVLLCDTLCKGTVNMEREFTAIIEKHGKWYVAWVEEIPGAHTQGCTLVEVRRNLKEVIHDLLELRRDLSAKDRSRSTRREAVAVEI